MQRKPFQSFLDSIDAEARWLFKSKVLKISHNLEFLNGKYDPYPVLLHDKIWLKK